VAPFVHEARGRSYRAALTVAAVWAVLLACWVMLDAAGWLMLLIGAFTLPALHDLWRNPSSGVRLDDTILRWHSGTRGAEVALAGVDHVRLDTRLDFSVRATVVPCDGPRLRLPFESTPPHRAFETALEARGVKVRRTHFQLVQ
jgi:hypothetical protein